MNQRKKLLRSLKAIYPRGLTFQDVQRLLKIEEPQKTHTLLDRLSSEKLILRNKRFGENYNPSMEGHSFLNTDPQVRTYIKEETQSFISSNWKWLIGPVLIIVSIIINILIA